MSTSDGPRYLYSAIIPRTDDNASLGLVVPRLIRAADRYGDLVQLTHGMARQVEVAPTATAKRADIGRANPPFEVDFTDSLPWSNAAEIRLLISEILHHLRATADYLVYNVAWLDSGNEQARTQFPVFKTEADFKSNAPRMLTGVNAEHALWIKAVQPFNGVQWTGDLAYLSNNDKHNYLLEVCPTLRFRIDLHSGSPVAGDPESVNLPVDQLQVELNLLRRGATAYEKVDSRLGDIISGLADLLNQFLREAGISEVKVSRT